MRRESFPRRAHLSAALMFLAAAASANEETRPNGANASQSERHGSAYVDPLGFLLFGPRVGVEVGAGQVSGGIYGRWFSPGVLAHSLFLASGDEFGFSYGVGVAGRYYLSKRLERLHLGVAVEYLSTKVENPTAGIVTKSAYLVPQLEFGHRWPIGAFYADASLAAGYALRLSGKVEDLPGSNSASDYAAKNESSFYGSASLELGVYF
jgi:hypothetical protein